MIDIIVKLSDITNTNFRNKFSNELDALTSSDVVKDNIINKRIEYLQQILSNYDAALLLTKETAAIVNSYDSKDNDNIIATTDKFIYSHPWKQLAPIHRMLKIKEYLNFLPSSSFKNNIISELEGLVLRKKLVDPIHIIYSPEQQKMIDIPCLDIVSETMSNGLIQYKHIFNL